MTTVYPNEFLTPTYMLGVIQERPGLEKLKETYLWREYFPAQQTPERRLTWESVRFENNLAGLYDPKGAAVPMDDELFSTYFANLIDVRASKAVDADVLALVRDPGMPDVYKAGGETSFVVQGIAQRVKQHVDAAVEICDNAVEATLEYFAINALRGEIVWPPVDENGNPISTPMQHWNPKKNVSVSFPRYDNFSQNASTLAGWDTNGTQAAWNTDNANPVYDLEVIAALMDEQEGINMDNATVLMSRGTLAQISRNASFMTYVIGTGAAQDGARDFYGYKKFQEFMLTRTGLNIQIYRGSYTYRTDNAGTRPTIHRTRFLPEGEVLIIPQESKPVGNMMFAPHEDENGNWVFGKAPRIYRDPRTFEREIEVHTVAWPIVTRGLEVFQLKAYL